MTSNNSYIITGDKVSGFCDGSSFSYKQGKKGYKAILEALKTEDWDSVLDVIEDTQQQKVEPIEDGRVVLNEDGTAMLNGKEVPEYMAKRLYAAMQQGMPVDGHIKYIENLAQNPSSTARERLTDFLTASSIGITSEGMLGCYKKVNSDYTDVRTGTMDNSIGQVVTMHRDDVDDDHRRTCSSGLHVCSEGYLNNYPGNAVIYVTVNPKDVVAIPYDYNNSKMRVCKYTVAADVTEQVSDDAFFNQAMSGDISSFADVFEDDEDFLSPYLVKVSVSADEPIDGEFDYNSCVEWVSVEAYSKKDAAGKAVSELMGKYDPFTHVFEVYNCELV